MEIKQVVEVHNVWTIDYGLNQDGTELEEKAVEACRPRDWGHPRWHYHLAKVEFEIGDTLYINHCHCWTDAKRDARGYVELFADLAFELREFGLRREVCAPEFLCDDDFWSDEWDMTRWDGEMPPYVGGLRDDGYAVVDLAPNQRWHRQFNAYLAAAYLYYKRHMGDDGVLLERADISVQDLMR